MSVCKGQVFSRGKRRERKKEGKGTHLEEPSPDFSTCLPTLCLCPVKVAGPDAGVQARRETSQGAVERPSCVRSEGGRAEGVEEGEEMERPGCR